MTMESIRVSAWLPAKPERVYRAWLSGEEHGAMTGGGATVEPEVGGRFTAWDGYIEGETVALEEDAGIVQTWRTNEFPEDAEDSRLEVHLEPEGEGTRITFVHTGIPQGQGARYEQGWQDHYLEPMKRYFEEQRGIDEGPVPGLPTEVRPVDATPDDARPIDATPVDIAAEGIASEPPEEQEAPTVEREPQPAVAPEKRPARAAKKAPPKKATRAAKKAPAKPAKKATKAAKKTTKAAKKATKAAKKAPAKAAKKATKAAKKAPAKAAKKATKAAKKAPAKAAKRATRAAKKGMQKAPAKAAKKATRAAKTRSKGARKRA